VVELLIAMAKKKAVSFYLLPQTDRKLKELAKKSGFSKSQILEYAILQALPDPDNDEEVKKFAMELANWIVEMKLKNDRDNGQQNSGIIIVK
jgi:predicted transcriptional regulator